MAVSPLICRGHFVSALIVARHHRPGDHQPLFFSFIIKIKDKKRENEGIRYREYNRDKERRRRHRSCSHSSDRLRNRPKSLSPSRALSKRHGFLLFLLILTNKYVQVCRNGSSHLRGNVYVLYKSLESAVLAYHSVNGRYFVGKQVFDLDSLKYQGNFLSKGRLKRHELGEASTFLREASTFLSHCLRVVFATCSRGMACNFIHCFRNPGRDYEWADWDKPPPRYWVKKMAALFGYSNESGTWNQECSGQTRNKIDSTNADSIAILCTRGDDPNYDQISLFNVFTADVRNLLVIYGFVISYAGIITEGLDQGRLIV
ncbi:hypothetical protein WN943_019714 [Citrus x changshan-huyou]